MSKPAATPIWLRSLRRRTPYASLAVPHQRSLSSSSPSRDELPAVEQSEDDHRAAQAQSLTLGLTGARSRERKQRLVRPTQWLTSEEALKFKDPSPGSSNWIGGDVPFPLNPWFRPRPPLSNALRAKIFESFKARLDLQSPTSHSASSIPATPRPEKVLVRETSAQWGVPISRVDAAIRLKAFEAHLVASGKPLQIHFEKGMESYLGADSRQVKQTELDEVRGEVERRERLKQEKKSKFYGLEFVPLDEPEPRPEDKNLDAASAGKAVTDEAVYTEAVVPAETRQIFGKDGLPRPSPYHRVRAPGKVPMVFRDTSGFPRVEKIVKGQGRASKKPPLRR